MIPHRMLSDEIFGNELKDRVSACRRRVRASRVNHRVHRAEDVAAGPAGTSEFPADSVPVRQLVRLELQSPEEQEVGIT